MGVWNGRGYGIAVFLALNFQIRSLNFGENRSLCGVSGISCKFRALKIICRTLEHGRSIRLQSIPYKGRPIFVRLAPLQNKLPRKVVNSKTKTGRRKGTKNATKSPKNVKPCSAISQYPDLPCSFQIPCCFLWQGAPFCFERFCLLSQAFWGFGGVVLPHLPAFLSCVAWLKLTRID